MIIYAVLGSAPVHFAVPAAEGQENRGLVSFFDHPKAFPSLSLPSTKPLQRN